MVWASPLTKIKFEIKIITVLPGVGPAYCRRRCPRGSWGGDGKRVCQALGVGGDGLSAGGSGDAVANSDFFKKINNSLRENLCAQYGNSARITLLTTASWWRARRQQKSGSQVSSEKKVFRKKCFSLEKKNVRALLYLTYPRTARADRYRALPRSQTRGSLEVGAVLAGGVAAAGNDYVQ